MAIEPENIKLNYIPITPEEISQGGLISGSGGYVLGGGFMQSPNYVAGSSGWKIDANGNIEANSVTLTGSITATTGAIGGWSINATSIYTGTEDHSGYTANAGDITLYSSGSDASIHAKNFYIDTSGNLTCQNATISGVITVGATSSGIANFSDAGDLATTDEADANVLNMTNAPAAAGADVTQTIIDGGIITTGYITLDTAGHIKSGQTGYDTGTGFWLGNDSGTPKFSIGVQAGNKLTWDGSALTINGSVITSPTITGIATGSEIAIQGWTHDLVFSVTDADTVAWASGTITLMNGDTYSIDAGNTGNMVAETYIYLDIATSTTVLQTTTTKATAVGSGKIMVAIAENATSEAEFVVFGSAEANLDGAKIRTNSITANEIAANTITASEIFAGTITATEMTIATLSAITANLGTITAGNITLDSSGYIKGGQTAYNTGTGFFLGYDTDAYKFSVGNPAGNYITWDGTTLIVNGYALATDIEYAAGDDLFASSDASKESLSLTYEKAKEFEIVKGGEIRVKFDIKSREGLEETVYGRIYRNGEAVGTEQSTTSVDYVTKSEDISGWSKGDLLQLYYYTSAGTSHVNVQNFRLYADTYEITTSLLD